MDEWRESECGRRREWKKEGEEWKVGECALKSKENDSTINKKNENIKEKVIALKSINDKIG